jgi:membrane-associated phospholipid phosphatase
VKRFADVLRIWFLALAACAAAAAFSFKKLDVPVARRVWGVGHHLASLNTAFGATVVLSLESAVVLGVIVARLTRGHISRFAETLALACLASICAYGINDEVLKPFFGVQGPVDVIEGAGHSLNFAKGFAYSSFPSGHMMLTGAFAGVFMRFYRRSIGPLAVLLLIAAALLVVGDWHFISDVIAGTFLGVSAGILAGEGWNVHMVGPNHG